MGDGGLRTAREGGAAFPGRGGGLGFRHEPGVRIIDDGSDDRLVGRAGGDTLTGGAAHGILRPLATTPFRAAITDVWPGAGSNDRRAFPRRLFPSRE